MTIVINESVIAPFAIAHSRAAMHKDGAFQASSPKNFSAGLLTGLFFGRGLRYSILAQNAPSTKYTERSQPVTTGTGTFGPRGIESIGVSDSPPRCFPLVAIFGQALPSSPFVTCQALGSFAMGERLYPRMKPRPAQA